MSGIRRHVMFGAIGGAIALLVILGIAGVILAAAVGLVGAVIGGVVGLVTGILTVPLRLMRGNKNQEIVSPSP